MNAALCSTSNSVVQYKHMKIIGFSGYSGAGKTTLIEKLIPRFTAAGLRVSLIKHAHHSFDVDQPGKDSHRHRQAGCQEVLIASSQRWALMHELRGAPEPALDELIARLSACDLLLIEGFKHAAMAKIEVYCSTLNEPPLFGTDPHIVAIVADRRVASDLPQFDRDDVAAVAAFIRAHLGLA
jgi:molybdopterin-guanine dinucleotide biosynthesis adapter protein